MKVKEAGFSKKSAVSYHTARLHITEKSKLQAFFTSFHCVQNIKGSCSWLECLPWLLGYRCNNMQGDISMSCMQIPYFESGAKTE
jgi:hypothetical protein